MQLALLLLGSVFLNGVKIDGLTNQTFRGCDVTIDAQGNVLISARGYSVERREVKQQGGAPGTTVNVVVQSQPAEPAAPAKLTKRYFLVSMQNRTGATQYDVDVIINGRFVATIRGKEMQVIKEITPYIVPGTNQIVMAAKKSYGGGARVSSAPADFFKIILGEGTETAGKVVIDNPLVDFKRTADETSNLTETFELKGR